MTCSISGVPSIIADAQYVAGVFAKQKQTQEPVPTPEDAFRSIQLMNKIHNDKLAVDPTWINGVHCHASVSRHNYIYVNMAHKPLANQ